MNLLRGECEVYPRACGGTSESDCSCHHDQGLSPRLRGNGQPGVGVIDGQGSIPALAGERLRACGLKKNSGVYPRACGGTLITPGNVVQGTGLSPRLRGNAVVFGFGIGIVGSIPALAGERWSAEIWRLGIMVYPRACGGTLLRSNLDNSIQGLSPRLRGNDESDASPQALAGSIPALAGER